MVSSSDDLFLNYHIMHPGGASEPADPNGAFFYGNKYHLHYILQHDYQFGDDSKKSYSYIHITSNDLLNCGLVVLYVTVSFHPEFLTLIFLVHHWHAMEVCYL